MSLLLQMPWGPAENFPFSSLRAIVSYRPVHSRGNLVPGMPLVLVAIPRFLFALLLLVHPPTRCAKYWKKIKPVTAEEVTCSHMDLPLCTWNNKELGRNCIVPSYLMHGGEDRHWEQRMGGDPWERNQEQSSQKVGKSGKQEKVRKERKEMLPLSCDMNPEPHYSVSKSFPILWEQSNPNPSPLPNPPVPLGFLTSI